MKSQAPLIAVVTPVYNGGKFLARAMEAVQAQTYRPLIHVVLDNCSADDTPAIIERFRGGAVPIVTKRNGAVLPASANWSEAVRMVPPDVAYFKILCADDLMTPDAIAKMVAVAQSADDVRVVLAAERINGEPLRPNIPPDASVFEANNMLARLFNDGVGAAYHHAMYRIDTRDTGGDFFPAGAIAFDADAACAVLARGGRCGFVHEPVVETIAHAGTLTATWTKKAAQQDAEFLARIHRYGPATFSRVDYERLAKRQTLRVYRKAALLALKGKGDLFKANLAKLAELGLKPSLLDFMRSFTTWPGEVYYHRVICRRPFTPWPAGAFRPADMQGAARAEPPLRDAS